MGSEQGADGWSWDTVLPYFRKLESDADFSGDQHGQDGPIAIHRQPYNELSGFVRSTVDVLTKRGYKFVDDQNAEWGDGITRVAMTASEENDRLVRRGDLSHRRSARSPEPHGSDQCAGREGPLRRHARRRR